jgi:hypothetical protein
MRRILAGQHRRGCHGCKQRPELRESGFDGSWASTAGRRDRLGITLRFVDGTLTVAVFAVILSGVSSIVAAVALRYSHRADRRAEAQEQRERARFEREEAEAEAEGQARLNAEWVGFHPEVSKVYRFRVTNVGKAPAMHLVLILEDANGQSIGRSDPTPTILPGDDAVGVAVMRRAAAWTTPLALRFEWRDLENEPRQQRSEVEISESEPGLEEDPL